MITHLILRSYKCSTFAQIMQDFFAWLEKALTADWEASSAQTEKCLDGACFCFALNCDYTDDDVVVVWW